MKPERDGLKCYHKELMACIQNVPNVVSLIAMNNLFLI